jgi:hypothetical protein
MTISHFTRTLFLTGGDAGRLGRERLRDECLHTKHPHIKAGTVNRQYNETELFLREDAGLLSYL